MRVEVQIAAGDGESVILGFNKSTIVYEDGVAGGKAITQAHLMDIYAAIAQALEEGAEAVRVQAQRLGVQLEG